MTKREEELEKVLALMVEARGNAPKSLLERAARVLASDYQYDGLVHCGGCGHEALAEEFWPTDGRPNLYGCPGCGHSEDCFEVEG